ncbi:MAG: gfo/Idh/MocA family oxidoreductase [Chloroflexi bacterium]|nr:MAG: gfo/Idh/MocA family oxidoreductase [Chloroflexota bacterium]
MSKLLRALILGTGFAGQGHALALRDAGVEVVGMAGRTPDVVEQVAASLDIPHASTDWAQSLAALQPDIVAVGTPGGVHFEPVMAALAQGCHIYCDKPLAATAAQARAMFQESQKRGVKTAFAASYRYQPYALLAKELVADGAIGEAQEVECISHFNLNPLIPFGWSHRLELGGGRLNNNFTHKLSIVLHVLESTLVAVNGETRNDMPQAPVVAGVHHFRERKKFAPKSADEPGLQWADANAEWSYTVMARITPAAGHSRPVSTLFKHSGLQPRFAGDCIAFYGDKAAIYIKGHYAQGPLYLCPRGGEWQEIPLPARITESLPNITDDTQRNWTHLAREFVADIRGQDNTGYQTFEDGWIYQEVIEAIRAGQGWVNVPNSLASGR